MRRGRILRNMGLGDDFVHKVFSSVAPKYDLMNDVMSFGVHRYWKNYFVDSCVRPQAGKKFLDVAGGTGDIAFRIAQHIGPSRVNPTLHPHAHGVAATAAAAAGKAATTGAAATVETPVGKSTEKGESKPEGAAAASSSNKEFFIPSADVVVVDINESMLEEGQLRAQREGFGGKVDWVLASAEELPFHDATFDSYTIAFGIRNVSNRLTALKEAHRVLRVGGVLNVLEFSKVECSVLAMPYDVYSEFVIPTAGQVIAGDRQSYKYLVDSIRAFPDQEAFAALVSSAGFDYVRYQNLTGGIACIHTGVKIK